jgi:hypothetical protein
MEEARRGGGAQGAAEAVQEERQKEPAGLSIRRKNLIYPTVHIKQVTIHSSILQITGVSSQTVAFRRELRIRNLR